MTKFVKRFGQRRSGQTGPSVSLKLLGPFGPVLCTDASLLLPLSFYVGALVRYLRLRVCTATQPAVWAQGTTNQPVTQTPLGPILIGAPSTYCMCAARTYRSCCCNAPASLECSALCVPFFFPCFRFSLPGLIDIWCGIATARHRGM